MPTRTMLARNGTRHPQRWRGFMTSWPQAGVPVGLLLSTGMIKLMSGAAAYGVIGKVQK